MTHNEQIKYLSENIRQGNYDCISLLGNSSDNGLTSLEALYFFYDRLPDNVKYKVVLDVYTNINGVTSPMKKYIRDIKKYRPTDYLGSMPIDIQDKNIITIYRAGSEELSKAPYSISWTLDIEVAKRFYNKLPLLQLPARLYLGQIHVKDIIAYTNIRNELEILQYRGVKQIEEINP